MEKKELRPVTSLGMFDLLKGVSILMVFFYHSSQVFQGAEPKGSGGALLFLCFFVCAGYGFRVRPVKKAIRQAGKMFLKPYFLTEAAALLSFFFVYSFGSRTFPQLLSYGLPYVSGALLGQMYPTEYFGFSVSACGPVWFLVSVSEAWILLDVALKYFGEKKTAVLAAVCCLLAPYLDALNLPFSLNRLGEAFPGLFLGYLLHNRGWLEKKLPLWVWGGAVLGFALRMLGGEELLSRVKPLMGFTDNLACLGIIYIFTHINRRYNPILGLFEAIGHNSLLWLCLHTVEWFALPWAYLFQLLERRVAVSPTVGALTLFALRTVLIWIGTYVVSFAKNKLEEKGIVI